MGVFQFFVFANFSGQTFGQTMVIFGLTARLTRMYRRLL